MTDDDWKDIFESYIDEMGADKQEEIEAHKYPSAKLLRERYERMVSALKKINYEFEYYTNVELSEIAERALKDVGEK